MSAEPITQQLLCVSCNKESKFTYDKKPFCSNRCLRNEFGNPKLSSEAKFLYSIKAGVDNAIGLHGCTIKVKDRYERRLSKAILKLSKKSVKPIYARNEGALPREWR